MYQAMDGMPWLFGVVRSRTPGTQILKSTCARDPLRLWLSNTHGFAMVVYP